MINEVRLPGVSDAQTTVKSIGTEESNREHSYRVFIFIFIFCCGWRMAVPRGIRKDGKNLLSGIGRFVKKIGNLFRARKSRKSWTMRDYVLYGHSIYTKKIEIIIPPSLLTQL